MNVVSSGIYVCCIDNTGSSEIIASSFDESIDEITITSEFRNEKLNRGWIGDIGYVTSKNSGLEQREGRMASDKWKDVLLTSVRLSYTSRNPNIWEYRFLKK